MSGIRMTEGASGAVATPPASKATLFLDDTLHGFAVKKPDGSVVPLIGATGATGAGGAGGATGATGAGATGATGGAGATGTTGATGAAGSDTYYDNGDVGATATINLANGNLQRIRLTAATCTLTFSGAPAAGTPGFLSLEVVQDGTGGRLITWPVAVTWLRGTAVVLQTAIAAVDLATFVTVDGGTTWLGSWAAPGATGATGTAGGGGATGATGVGATGATGTAGASSNIVSTQFARHNSGDYTLNNTSFTDVDTGLDLTIAAATGDKLAITLGSRWGAEAVNGFLDVATIVSASPVNYVSGGTGGGSDFGVEGWLGLSGVGQAFGATAYYTVQAGDISGGNVKLRLRYRTGSAAAKTLRAGGAGTGALFFGVVNNLH